jgi:hypothetical protein
MDVLAHTVQRHLEHIGWAWLEDAGDEQRPEALVALLAYGTAHDIEPHADRALAQLREAEQRYRSGEVDASQVAQTRWCRARRRSHRLGRWLRIGALVIAVLVLWALVLSAFGSWGAPAKPTSLTTSERMF